MEDMEIDINNFIPNYPDIDDPDFNYDILRKAEFYDLRLDPTEEKPSEKGELLYSQKLLQRFFSPHTQYNKSLFFHDPGTGKCVHPDTVIDTDKGLIMARNIWDSFSTNYVYDGEGWWADSRIYLSVKSYNEEKGIFEYRNIDKLYKQHINENIKRVQLENGKFIEITNAHKLYIYKNIPTWTTEFQKGDFVILDGLVKSKITKIISYKYSGFVYDFEVSQHHNYIANGIVCHNTCLLSAIIEASKNSQIGGVNRKRALVIVKNDGLRKKLISDISNVCTSGVYIANISNLDYKKGITKETKLRRLKAEIIKNYEIVTIETFLKHLPDSPEFIEATYSNRDIIIDEAHVLRIQPSKKVKKDSTKTRIIEDKDPKIDIKQYEKMYKFLHIVKNSRILLFTGTPIWDDVSEIASLMNLIIHEKDQLPTGKNFKNEFFDENDNLIDTKIPLLKERFKGKISYLRKMISTAKREEIGTAQPWLNHIKVFPNKMSEDQAKYVRHSREQETEGKEGGRFSRNAREASNMIVPVFKNGKIDDYLYGSTGFDKYAKKKTKTIEGKEGDERYAITDPLLKAYIKNNLRDISAKFSNIIQDIKDHPNQIIFIYNEFVIGSGGAIMLALCMEIHGFVWVKDAKQILNPSDKKRFAVITSNKGTTHQPEKIKELLDSFNKPDNKYGERLQIIIGSERIALGYDIKNVRREHIITGHWNMSSLDQAKARGYRFGGHEDLPLADRNIKIFSHVAVEAGDINFPAMIGYPTNKGFSDYETIDIHVYKKAEEKEIKNTQIYRVMKEVAYDCGLFYKRNVLETDTDGTRDCDYMKCKYKCDGLSINKKYPKDPYRLNKEELDYSTYNLLYGDLHMQKMIEDIVELFGNYFSLHIYLIQELLDINPDIFFILIKALDIIIDTRISIKDRYGFNRYLKEDGNIYFLDSSISGNSRYLESTYVSKPLVSDITSLETLVNIMELENDNEKVKDFCKAPSEEIFNSLSYKTKIILLEEAYKRKLKEEKISESEKIILNQMESDIYIVGDNVHVHNLYSTEYKGMSFDIAGKKIKTVGEMRYYDVEDEMWKNMTDEITEREYYEEIKLHEEDTDKLFVENPYNVYGIISKKDNKFRIRLKPEKGKRTTGLVCSSFEESDLRHIFIHNLKRFPKINDKYDKFDKEKLLKLIKGYPSSSRYKNLPEKDEEYLRSILTLFTLSKGELCAEILKIFKKLKILYVK